MKVIHRRDADSLSPITKEDLEFANKIVKEYDLPSEDITWLVRDVRDEILHNIDDFKKLSKFRPLYKKCQEVLFGSDLKIKELKITTNKGEVIIKSSDPFFDLFSFSIKKTKSNFRNSLYQEVHYITTWSKQSPVNKIALYFLNKPQISKKSNKIIAISKFLVHFKLFSQEPILTEQEFRRNIKLTDSDYNDYLYSRGKSLLKKFLPEDQILFIDNQSGQT